MPLSWDENLSNELKKLNTIAKPTPSQKQRIATLKGVKQASGGTVTNKKFVDYGIDKKTGTIDPNKAINAVQGAEQGDISKNITLGNPDQTDIYGNRQTVTIGPDGKPIVTQTAGGASQAFTNAAMGAVAGYDPNKGRQAAYDAEFAQRTQYLDRNKGRDLEDAKQELANRGIPYDPAAATDPNTKNLYGRTIGGINENYQGQYKDASNAALTTANQTVATNAGANASFVNSALQGANTFGGNFNPYAGTTTDSSGDVKDILGMSAQQYATLHGISVQQALEEARIRKSGSSGGGQKSSGNSGGGFEILG